MDEVLSELNRLDFRVQWEPDGPWGIKATYIYNVDKYVRENFPIEDWILFEFSFQTSSLTVSTKNLDLLSLKKPGRKPPISFSKFEIGVGSLPPIFRNDSAVIYNDRYIVMLHDELKSEDIQDYPVGLINLIQFRGPNAIIDIKDLHHFASYEYNTFPTWIPPPSVAINKLFKKLEEIYLMKSDSWELKDGQITLIPSNTILKSLEYAKSILPPLTQFSGLTIQNPLEVYEELWDTNILGPDRAAQARQYLDRNLFPGVGSIVESYLIED